MSRFRKLVAFVATATIVLSAVITFTPQASAFVDVPSSNQFASFINDLSSRGIISSNNPVYNPTVPSTRGELVKIVVNATGTPINTAGGPTFSDVPVGSTFYTFVETAVNNGWVSGYGNGTFGPNNRVTRGEAAKIVTNAFNLSLKNPASPTFSDVSPSNVFYSYIETLVDGGMIRGYADGRFGANNPVLRQELAKIISGSIAYVEAGPAPVATAPVSAPVASPVVASPVVDSGTPPPPSSNNLTVRLSASTPPSRHVPQGGNNITHLSFDVTAGTSEDIMVTQLIISRKGLGDFDDFDEVNVFDGITRIGSSRTFTSDDNIATFNFFNTPVLVPRGVTKTIDIKANIVAGLRGQSSDRSGNASYFSIESAADMTAVGVDSGGAVAVSGDFPVEGNPQQIATISIGKLTLRQGTTPPSKVNIGEQDADFGQLLFDVDGREDILVTSLILENKGSASGNDISNVALFDNSTGEQLGETVVNLVNDKAVFDLRGEPNGGLLINDGDSERVNIRGDVNDGSVSGKDTVRFELDELSDMIAIGQTFGFPTSISDGREASCTSNSCGLLGIPAANRDILIEGGQLTFDFQKPEETDIAADTNDAIIAVMNITNRGEGALVRDLFFDVFVNGEGSISTSTTGCPTITVNGNTVPAGGGSGGASCKSIVNGVAGPDKADALDNVEIVAPDGSIAAGPIDAVQVTESSTTANKSSCLIRDAGGCRSDWLIKFTDDFIIPTSSETQVYRIKSDIQTEADNDDVYQLQFNPGSLTFLQVDGAITNDQLQEISPNQLIVSDAILIQDETLDFALSTTPVSDTIIRGNEYDVLGVTMQAGDSGDVIVTSLIFDLLQSGGTTGNSFVANDGVTVINNIVGQDIVIARLYDENGNLLDDDIVNSNEKEVIFDNIRPQVLVEAGGQRKVVLAIDVNSSASAGSNIAFTFTPTVSNVSAEDTEGDTLENDQLLVGGLPGIGGTRNSPAIADNDPANNCLNCPLAAVAGANTGDGSTGTNTTGTQVLLTIQSAGKLAVTLDNDSPDAAQVQAGASLVPIGKIEFAASDEDVFIEQVSVAVDFLENNRQLQRVYLFDGNTQVGDAKSVTATVTRPAVMTWDFTGANRVRIVNDGQKSLDIKADFNITNNSIALSGQGITMSVVNIEAEGSKEDVRPDFLDSTAFSHASTTETVGITNTGTTINTTTGNCDADAGGVSPFRTGATAPGNILVTPTDERMLITVAGAGTCTVTRGTGGNFNEATAVTAGTTLIVRNGLAIAPATTTTLSLSQDALCFTDPSAAAAVGDQFPVPIDNPNDRKDDTSNNNLTLGDMLIEPVTGENLSVLGFITDSTVCGGTAIKTFAEPLTAVAIPPLGNETVFDTRNDLLTQADTTTATAVGMLVRRNINQTTATNIPDQGGAFFNTAFDVQQGVRFDEFTPYDTLLTVSLAANPTYGERGAPTTSQKIFGFVLSASQNSADPRNQKAIIDSLTIRISGSADVSNLTLFDASDDVEVGAGAASASQPGVVSHTGNGSDSTDIVFDFTALDPNGNRAVDSQDFTITEGTSLTFYVEGNVQTFTFDQAVSVEINDLGDEFSTATTPTRSDVVWRDCDLSRIGNSCVGAHDKIFWVDQEPNDVTPPPQTFVSKGGSATLDNTRPKIVSVDIANDPDGLDNILNNADDGNRGPGADGKFGTTDDTVITGRIDPGDTITITFNEPIDPKSIFTPTATEELKFDMGNGFVNGVDLGTGDLSTLTAGGTLNLKNLVTLTFAGGIANTGTGVDLAEPTSSVGLNLNASGKVLTVRIQTTTPPAPVVDADAVIATGAATAAVSTAIAATDAANPILNANDDKGVLCTGSLLGPVGCNDPAVIGQCDSFDLAERGAALTDLVNPRIANTTLNINTVGFNVLDGQLVATVAVDATCSGATVTAEAAAPTVPATSTF